MSQRVYSVHIQFHQSKNRSASQHHTDKIKRESVWFFSFTFHSCVFDSFVFIQFADDEYDDGLMVKWQRRQCEWRVRERELSCFVLFCVCVCSIRLCFCVCSLSYIEIYCNSFVWCVCFAVDSHYSFYFVRSFFLFGIFLLYCCCIDVLVLFRKSNGVLFTLEFSSMYFVFPLHFDRRS